MRCVVASRAHPVLAYREADQLYRYVQIYRCQWVVPNTGPICATLERHHIICSSIEAKPVRMAIVGSATAGTGICRMIARCPGMGPIGIVMSAAIRKVTRICGDGG